MGEGERGRGDREGERGEVMGPATSYAVATRCSVGLHLLVSFHFVVAKRARSPESNKH